MWKIFKIFNSVYHKIKWVFNFVKVFISPIYDDLVKISVKVKDSNLENEEARKQVFQEITDIIQAKGIKISDSILNLSIEIVYQLVKSGRN